MNDDRDVSARTAGSGFTVGLTGGIGSGKSTVAQLFADLGVAVVDTDLLARQAVEPGTAALAAIAERFGADLLDSEGRLRRGSLRQRVFASEPDRRWLESLLHPVVHRLTAEGLRRCRGGYRILASPLLLESGQTALVNRVLVVDLPEDEQLRRGLARDGGDAATMKSIIASQMPRATRLRRADDVIDNSASKAALAAKVRELHERYLRLGAMESP